ncbi:MAG: cytochrome [Pseudonocardiales bacterium]|nr:cytochrome [Pseudonocardiales bacterium]
MPFAPGETTAQQRDAFADFDHNDPAVSAEQFRARHDEMRETCPVAHSSQYGGFDVLTRYDDVRAVLSAPALFSSADGVFIPPSGFPRVAAMEFDDPKHTMWRRLMGPPLTIRAVREFEPTILEIIDSLIDSFVADGSADLVRDIAEPLPSLVVGRVVGLGHDESLAGRDIASRVFAAIGSAEFTERLDRFQEFVDEQLDERRRHPKDDFLTQIASGAVDGVPINSAGAASLMVSYIVGGHHSTGSGIAGLLRDVLTDDLVRQAVTSDPAALSRAVDESLRLNTPLQYFARSVVEDTAVGGESIGKGGRVLVDLAAANRDPRQFEHPERFDLGRRRNPHVAFGAGAHVCLGQHLARAEMRLVVGRLLERLPDLRLVGDAPEAVVAGKLVTTRALPVEFTPGS